MMMVLPFTNVTLEGHIGVIYYILNKYSNKALQCKEDDFIDAKSDILAIDQPQDPFSKNFQLYGRSLANTHF